MRPGPVEPGNQPAPGPLLQVDKLSVSLDSDREPEATCRDREGSATSLLK